MEKPAPASSDSRHPSSEDDRSPAADPASSDPVELGWMQGFPPSAERTIRFDDGSLFRFPRTRWSFSHMRELVPTVNVWRGNGPASGLPDAPRDLDSLRFACGDREQSWAGMLTDTYTDSVLVMHRGLVVYERYFGAAMDRLPHSCYSISKSFVGTLAAMLAHEGSVDPSAPVTKYIPELKDTAYGDATVRHVMDMQVGVRYSEDYADKNAEIWDYSRAGGMSPKKSGAAGPANLYEFLRMLRKQGEHGEAFAYKTVNTEVLAWVLRRVTGMSIATLLSERIWQRIGAENDAYFQVDSIGTEASGGGLHVTLRDLARFGEMMRLGGRWNGEQVVPKEAVDDIRAGSDRAKFAKGGYPSTLGYQGYSYRNMWWISHNAHGVFDGRGIYGQRLYIDPAAEMVIAKFSSHPVAANIELIPLTDLGFQAVAQYLMEPA
jgi:CubicO group peptidase (beta-lactamase class C family)